MNFSREFIVYKSDLLDAISANNKDIRNEMRNDMHEMRNEMRNDMHGLRNEMRNDMHTLEVKLENKFDKLLYSVLFTILIPVATQIILHFMK